MMCRYCYRTGYGEVRCAAHNATLRAMAAAVIESANALYDASCVLPEIDDDDVSQQLAGLLGAAEAAVQALADAVDRLSAEQEERA